YQLSAISYQLRRYRGTPRSQLSGYCRVRKLMQERLRNIGMGNGRLSATKALAQDSEPAHARLHTYKGLPVRGEIRTQGTDARSGGGNNCQHRRGLWQESGRRVVALSLHR